MKNKIEWRVGYQLPLSKVVTYSTLTTRDKARAHMRGTKKLISETPNPGKVWMERVETVYKHEFGKDSFHITNVKRVR